MHPGEQQQSPLQRAKDLLEANEALRYKKLSEIDKALSECDKYCAGHPIKKVLFGLIQFKFDSLYQLDQEYNKLARRWERLLLN